MAYGLIYFNFENAIQNKIKKSVEIIHLSLLASDMICQYKTGNTERQRERNWNKDVGEIVTGVGEFVTSRYASFKAFPYKY